ncbi:hypothetical protein PGT21_015084 [Puccinia graminis f. sp. tritici]|uniref:Uncharacterized protein n=1 Tax=Puccinia graminis f. sp. tritici TaxID=56615 RepID=A0A5B0NC27_PUCGR|nr:hypothetical protein PGT21_015084 [Puccinia graminis f. sp. tritici]KAA1136095.1 hypothetical protein PGTUg99_028655 [Puccinia graminis f. sp. tritici]
MTTQSASKFSLLLLMLSLSSPKPCLSMEVYLEFEHQWNNPIVEKPVISQTKAAATQKDNLSNPSASRTSVRSRKGKNATVPCSSGENGSPWRKSIFTTDADASTSSANQLSPREERLQTALTKAFGPEYLIRIREAGFFDLAPRLTNFAGHKILGDLSDENSKEVRSIGNSIRDECKVGPIIQIRPFPKLPDTFDVSNALDIQQYGQQLSKWLEQTEYAWIEKLHAAENVSSENRDTMVSQLIEKSTQVKSHLDRLKEILGHEPEAFSTAFANRQAYLEEFLSDELTNSPFENGIQHG